VAISNMYPEAKSTAHWLRGSWHVPLSYIVGFLLMLLVIGWHADLHH
jgi:hypothetical protein